MKYLKIALSLLFLLVIFASSVATEPPAQAQTGESSPEYETGVYTPGVDDPAVPSAIAGFTDLVAHGSAWRPQTPWNLAYFKPYGWGTEIKGKGAGDQWIHMPIPYASYIDATALKVSHIEFCAKSTNGALTKPTRLDLWSNWDKIAQYTITWPADNGQHCAWVNYSTPAWRESLGMSVLVHFANATDRVVLYKAWVRLVP
jgi:hypothetical protein